MPELPEVETVRQSLLTRIVGREIVGLRAGEFAGVVGPLGVESTRARLLGRRFTDVRRRGKYLFLGLDDGTTLMIHLRMTGRLQFAARDDPPIRFEHLAIQLSGGSDLRYADQRKFGRVLHLMPDEAAGIEKGLGLEPIESSFTSDELGRLLANRTGRLKSLLLDQRLIAGLGNIYADEALFLAQLHPERPGNSLTGAEVRRLHAAIGEVLGAALRNRGTTISSYQDATGAAGENQFHLQVYGRGRTGEPCPRCGGPLAVILVGGRSSHFCGSCQPPYVSPAATT
jgi:formamidopyrimidine-DNA glycosylase